MSEPPVPFEADRVQFEAELWVRDADEDTLFAYAAAVADELIRRGFGNRNELRRVLMRLWQRLPETDRRHFLIRMGAV